MGELDGHASWNTKTSIASSNATTTNTSAPSPKLGALILAETPVPLEEDVLVHSPGGSSSTSC